MQSLSRAATSAIRATRSIARRPCRRTSPRGPVYRRLLRGDVPLVLGEPLAGARVRHGVHPAAFRLPGLPDAFLDAGALPTLHDGYRISTPALGPSIKEWLK